MSKTYFFGKSSFGKLSATNLDDSANFSAYRNLANRTDRVKEKSHKTLIVVRIQRIVDNDFRLVGREVVVFTERERERDRATERQTEIEKLP